MSYGATSLEWAHFSVMLGLTSHLLPVVSNPNAVISPKSTLKTLGKVPSRYDAHGQVVGIAKWPTIKATGAQIDHWSKESDYGICLQTRQVRALDLDLDDAREVGRIRALIVDRLGQLPCRARPQSFRVLLVFSHPDDLEKRSLHTSAGLVELLGDGQQFIAAGTHPSGGRYFWEGGLPDDIPVVSREALEALWKELGGEIKPIARLRPGGGVVVTTGPDPIAAWLAQRESIISEHRDGRYEIICPWYIDHTGDSGPTETIYYPAGTGGYAQGHFKCLHAHCSGRTDADFLKAIGFENSFVGDFPAIAESGVIEEANLPEDSARKKTNGVTPAAWKSDKPGEGLKRSRKGYLAELENIEKAITTPGFWYRLGFDEFRSERMKCAWSDALGEEQWSPVTDDDVVLARKALQHAGFEPVRTDLMKDALRLACLTGRFDSAQLWLGGITWDGRNRVESFFQTYCGGNGGKYETGVARYLWSALAGRVLEPGVQADMVPILVGAQGVGKTRGVEALVPWSHAYATFDLSLKDVDLLRRMRGRLVLEIAELDGLHTRDKKAIKRFMSEKDDTWVAKYEEYARSAARRCVFIGTTNDDEFLDDETGNRRWLPVNVGSINRSLLVNDRAQLWAEGRAIFLSEGVAFERAEALAKLIHDDFRMTDIWEDELSNWMRDNVAAGQPFTTREAALGIGLDPRTVTRSTEMRLAKALGQLKVVHTRGRPEGGPRKRVWIIR